MTTPGNGSSTTTSVSNPDGCIALDRLELGRDATVVRIVGEPRLRRRLLEMGFCTGIDVRAIRRAPLTDPIDFLVRGYHLSLRASDAASLLVKPR